MRRRFAVAQIGARMHYAVPAILHRAGMLETLYTDICSKAGWVQSLKRFAPVRVAPAPLRRLLGRTVPDVPGEKIVNFSFFGLKRYMNGARIRTAAQGLRVIAANNRRFCNLVTRKGLGDADALYAFNSAALEIMPHAEGRFIALEQIAAPFAFDEALLAEERHLWPGWENGQVSRGDWQPLAQRERAEWDLADVILCASQYVVDCIKSESGPAEKCAVVPYGVDCSRFAVKRNENSYFKNRPLRALCVAQVQLRKGVQYLMQAAAMLKRANIRIRLVGRVQVSDEALDQLRQVMDVAGPIPRSQMHEEFAAADLFVLPTLSEGSATVCYEALAAGLPVITTPHAGSVVRDGVEGFIVPIRDSKLLADRMVRLEADRSLLQRMSYQAVERAREFDWSRYAERLLEVLSK